MKVQCPSCKALTHQTTDLYDPDIRPDRTMVELLEPYKSWGYGDGFQDIECPACESPLAPSGRLRVVSDEYGKSTAKKQTEQAVEMFKRPPVTHEQIQQQYDKLHDLIDRETLENRGGVAKIFSDASLDVRPLSKAEQIRNYLAGGMPQAEIAKAIGTSRQYVSNVKRKMKDAEN